MKGTGQRRRVAVVGAGGAGLAAAERLAERGLRVELISSEPFAYSLCALPYLLSGEVGERGIQLLTEAAARRRGIRARFNRRAVSIDAKRMSVRLKDGTRVPCDAVLLAPGSVPRRLPIPGAGMRGVFTLNSLADCRALARAARRGRSAIIIGGGFTGLEAAAALSRRGLKVAVVEAEPRVLPGMVDDATSTHLVNTLQAGGITCRLRTLVREVGGAGRCERVELSTGERPPADLVVIATGVVPDTTLAGDAGLKVGRGILTDSTLETSAPGIYAAGDAAEFPNPQSAIQNPKSTALTALWYPAAVQGTVAAANIMDETAEFVPPPPGSVIRLFDETVATAGRGEEARTVTADAPPGGYIWGTPFARSAVERLGSLLRPQPSRPVSFTRARSAE